MNVKLNLLLTTLLFMSLSLKAQDQNIAFQSDGLSLNGTLSIPDGEGPFPIAILVHGSGPQNRNQTIALNDGNSQCLYPQLFGETIENFKDIAQFLRERGIAVLRYDKRTLTYGASLDPILGTPYDFITDIDNAIDFIKTKEEINTESIFLLGHSQGSTLIPHVAVNRNDIAGLISLSGPVTPIDTLLAEQYRNLYIDCANNPGVGEQVANQFYFLFENVRNNIYQQDFLLEVNFPGNTSNPVAFGFPTFWHDWIELSDAVVENYLASKLPALFIHGTEDWNVPIDDAMKFKSALPGDITTVEIFENVNHFLTPNDSPNVDDEVMNYIADWIKNLQPITSTEDIFFEEHLKVNVIANEIQIKFENPNHQVKKIFLHNLAGQKVYLNEIKDQPIHTINVGDFNGILVLSFHTDSNLYSKKIFIR